LVLCWFLLGSGRRGHTGIQSKRKNSKGKRKGVGHVPFLEQSFQTEEKLGEGGRKKKRNLDNLKGG